MIKRLTIPGRIGIWKCWFLRRGENRSLADLEKNLSEQRREPTTNSAHILPSAFNREAWTFFSRRFTFQTRWDVSQTTVSTGPMKMFRLEHKTRNVCQRNVAHLFCSCVISAGLTKLNDIFQGFGSLVSLWFQKDGGAKSKQIWTNVSHWNTGGSSLLWGVTFF